MHTSNLYTVFALLAATTGTYAQSTGSATVLIPDWCVTQATPTVTATGQGDLTTYSYLCPSNSVIVSSITARASSALESARSRASEVRSSLEARITGDSNDRRSFGFSNVKRQDDTCYGWGAFDGCIPWEVTQGTSTWAAHYTRANVVSIDQQCSFGDGGVSSGSATCTGSGRLDPAVWGDGDGSRTRTFAQTDVDRYWIRNGVAITSGGGPLPTNGATTTTGTASPTTTGAGDSQSTGMAAPRSVPTVAVAMFAGAGGLFAAAFAL